MNALAGTLRLTRLAARRDRITLPVWILGMATFLALTSAMFVDSLVTHADRVEEATVSASNVGLRMLGLTSGPTVGSAIMVRDYVTLAILAAVMSALTVVRHTRQSEELGRAEVLGATVVGQYADLAAGVFVALAANLVLAVTLGLAMVVNGLPATGSFAAGAAVAGVGVVFAGVAAVTVQLASTTRGAIGLATAVLGAAFVVGGVGNMLGTADLEAVRVRSAWPAWLSPIGWGQQMRPFGGDHWWPLLLFAVLAAALVFVAGLLVDRRDVGAGLWPQRRGADHAASGLLSAVGLVFRLQRGVLLAWTTGLLACGLIFGTLAEQMQDAGGRTREYYEELGGPGRVVEAYEAEMVGFAALMAAIYVVQMMVRLRADEAAGTAESLLATGVSRQRWVLAHALTALIGASVLMAAFSVSMGLIAGQVLGDPTAHLTDVAAAALVQLPALAVVGAAALALVGLVPRQAVGLAWGLLVLATFLGPMFGNALGLPDPVLDLSPFTHVPLVPADEVSAPPLLALAGVGVVLAALGATTLGRRDLALPA